MTLSTLLAALALAADPVAFVAVAPGYPGTTAEAQASMDAFAVALAAQSGLPAGSITAAYFEKDRAGAERLQKPDAALGMVSLPFFLKEGEALHLEPRLAAAQKGTGATEVWALVAKKGRVTGPGLARRLAGQLRRRLRPGLRHRHGPGRVGADAPSVKVVQSGQVLSSLRKAVAGENVAVLLDGAQAAALPTLPFAAELEVVARSAPLPTGVVVTVAKRLTPDRWKALEKGLRQLGDRPEGAAALEAIRLQGFVPLDTALLAAARKAYAAAAK